MKPKTDTRDVLLDIDDLNETVLEAAAQAHREPLAPRAPVENEQTIAEQLVSAGNEEADLEQRVAEDIKTRSRQ